MSSLSDSDGNSILVEDVSVTYKTSLSGEISLLRDSLTPMAQGTDIARLIPNAHWEVLPSAGHIPAIENPTSFDSALLDFLASPGVRADSTR